MRQDESYLYQKDCDGWLVTIRGDFAEMVKISTASNNSLYEKYEAPLEKIHEAVKELRSEGYILSYSLNLELKPLVAA